jgi:glycosyltransferase involved in cell wall biosynthesis
VLVRSFLDRRRVAFRFTAADLVHRFSGAYGLPRPLRVRVLPNIIQGPAGSPTKHAQPLVVYFGRLDPIKRPWIAIEVARMLPEARVALIGHNHLPEAFQPTDVPPNLDLVGHVAGDEKTRWLSEAWVLLNPSIHEALPISFLEALAHEVPLVSSVNPANLVATYGIHVPMGDGDGLQSVPAFAAAIRALITDRSRAAELGRAGRAWVEANHSASAFLEAFTDTSRRLGAPVPAALMEATTTETGRRSRVMRV